MNYAKAVWQRWVFLRVDPCGVLEYAGKVAAQGLFLWRRMPSFAVLEARCKGLNATEVTFFENWMMTNPLKGLFMLLNACFRVSRGKRQDTIPPLICHYFCVFCRGRILCRVICCSYLWRNWNKGCFFCFSFHSATVVAPVTRVDYLSDASTCFLHDLRIFFWAFPPLGLAASFPWPAAPARRRPSLR